jgi:Zn finger protein HypA/HybF involved in hydrogenase expression
MEATPIHGLDITAPEVQVEVEVQERYIPSGNRVLYVHVDGMTVLRVNMPEGIDFKVKLPMGTRRGYTKKLVDEPTKLTCHKCRHQQHRYGKVETIQICEKCGSDQVWI